MEGRKEKQGSVQEIKSMVRYSWMGATITQSQRLGDKRNETYTS